jgi:hypothetical protein
VSSNHTLIETAYAGSERLDCQLGVKGLPVPPLVDPATHLHRRHCLAVVLRVVCGGASWVGVGLRGHQVPDSKTPIDLYTYDTAPFTLDDYDMPFFSREASGFN